MASDNELLDSYATHRSEEAFAELVRRHLDLVYFTALRRTNGQAPLAEELAQQVFLALARQAPALRRHAVLTGWLYVATRHAAAKAMRGEQRRKARERAALAMHETSSDPTPAADWNRLRPELDAVLDDLNERDRNAVLLRFFENRPFAEIGAALRLSEDAARMRVDRALDKLRRLLARRGITSTTAALAFVLEQSAGVAAPATLAASISSAVMTSAAVGGAVTAASVSFFALMNSTKILLGVAGAITFFAVGAAVYEGGAAHNFEATALSLRSQMHAVPLGPAIFAAPSSAAPALGTNDYARMVDRLRGAGFSEKTVRVIMKAVLDDQLADRRRELFSHLPWWKETLNPAQVPEIRQVQIDHRQTMISLFGPAGNVEFMNLGLGFLPLEKRAQLEQIRFDYQDMLNTLQWRAGLSATERSAQQQKLKRDERTDMANLLTPEELNEYDMRNGPTAATVMKNVGNLEVDENQFKQLYALQARFDTQIRNLPTAFAATAENQYWAEVAAILPAEQFYPYLANADPLYGALSGVTNGFSVNPATVYQVENLIRQVSAREIPNGEGASQIARLLGPEATEAYARTSFGSWMKKSSSSN